VSAACVWRRADLLDLSAEPDDPRYPLVCVEEQLYQVVSEVRQALPLRPGQPVRYDDAYRREGTCNVFLGFEPRQGWRHVQVTDRRTAQDVAHGRQELVAVPFPQATVIRVVLDNLNPQTPAALSATFPPAEACRSLRTRDCHDTPKHGSGLTRADIEFAVVSTQGLDRRLGDQETVRRAIAAWETRRHAARALVDGRLTTAKARRKLKHLYSL
jgi:hypothetical protein